MTENNELETGLDAGEETPEEKTEIDQTPAPTTALGAGTNFVDAANGIDQRQAGQGSGYGGPYLDELEIQAWQDKHGEGTYPPGRDPHFNTPAV